MPNQPSTSLLTRLTSLQPGTAGALPRAVVMPPAPSAAASSMPAAHPRGASKAAARLLLARLARAILRHPPAKHMALALLARFPRLHARAVGMAFAPTSSITLGAPLLDPALAASLSPRARMAARRLKLAPPVPMQTGLPAPSDDAGWDSLIAALTNGAPPIPGRPRLAFVSPLPPGRTGIADYAVQLLPALGAWFDIELVVEQASVELPPGLAGLPLRDAAWLRAHAAEYDHILYQLGNSEFHSYMFALLRDYPGVVVLHDFFLGNVMAYRQMHDDPPGAWTAALFHAHGFPALAAYQQAASRPQLLKSHPCNLAVLEEATAVIVHSTHADELARAWYGPDATRNWHVAPLPRAAPPKLDRSMARAALGIGPDVFLVCSFGYIGQNKLTHRLIGAWLSSTLHRHPGCLLVLVGANHNSPFGARITDMVQAAEGSVRIAGWSDETVYRQYLQAADLGVQLRTSAQGETSAAVLDCMNYGLPTIVNANGSMAALPPDAVLRLPDVFDDAELIAALESLHGDSARRTVLGARAALLLATEYRPEHAAARYAGVLSRPGAGALEHFLAPLVAGQDDAVTIAAAMAAARRPGQLHVRQLLIDVSQDPASDDQYLAALLDNCGMRVELVRLHHEQGQWRIRYARSHAALLLNMSWEQPDDAVADLGRGDVFYSRALPAAMSGPAAARFCQALRARGIALALAVPASAGPDWHSNIAPLADLLLYADDGDTAALRPFQLS